MLTWVSVRQRWAVDPGGGSASGERDGRRLSNSRRSSLVGNALGRSLHAGPALSSWQEKSSSAGLVVPGLKRRGRAGGVETPDARPDPPESNRHGGLGADRRLD